MQRTKISSSLTMSRLVYGMWRLGDDQDTSPEHVRNKISRCLHQGITSFDQADIYGGYEAEEIYSTKRNEVESAIIEDLCENSQESIRENMSTYQEQPEKAVSSMESDDLGPGPPSLSRMTQKQTDDSNQEQP